ncbi:MAG: MFS transporter [Anaerolineae bacterium]|nr:MFS transporter [Anaerolineae bacterium]
MSLRQVPTEALAQPTKTETEPQSPSAPSRPRGPFSALSHPNFRLWFVGQLVSVSGTWMQSVAQQIVVYNLTGSEAALGVVSFVQGLAVLSLMPVSGVVVERFPRRRILVATQSTMMVTALIMALLMATGVLQIWHIVALAFVLGLVQAVDAPARLSFVSEMVGKEDLPSGILMNSMMFNMARIFGPALGGLALKTLGAEWCFFLNGLSFLAVIMGLLLMRVEPVKIGSGQRGFWKPLKEGLHFARQHSTIGPILILSVLTCVFSQTFIVLIAPFADKVLHDTEIGTSAIFTAQGIGALLAAGVVAWANVRGLRGRLLTFGALLGPAAVILLALSQTMIVAVAVAALAGFAFVCQMIMMNTLIQVVVPDEFRGRVLSLYTMTFFGLSPLGNLVIGATAEAIGTSPALIVFASIGLIGSAVTLWRAPQVTRMA